jgi:hypothetical protein
VGQGQEGPQHDMSGLDTGATGHDTTLEGIAISETTIKS